VFYERGSNGNGKPNELFRELRDRRRGTKLGAVALSSHSNERQHTMDKDRVKGAANQVKGAVKEKVGQVTGDTKTEAEGKADKATGKVQNAVGGLKDAVRGED
jgi:uncharacterized protein YjbJ (UPF0337 family)